MADERLLGRLIAGSSAAEVAMALLKGPYVKGLVADGATVTITLHDSGADTPSTFTVVPPGGGIGQVLKKHSADDGDVEWADDEQSSGGTPTIQDGSVTAVKLADGSVTHPKLAAEAVEADNLAGSVSGKLGTVIVQRERGSDVQAERLIIRGIEVIESGGGKNAEITIPASGLTAVDTSGGLTGAGTSGDPVRIDAGGVDLSKLSAPVTAQLHTAAEIDQRIRAIVPAGTPADDGRVLTYSDGTGNVWRAPAAADTSDLTPRPAVPAGAGFSVGEIINVQGRFYVLASRVANGTLHGTAVQIDSNYYGVLVIPNATHQGSWSDPAIRAEFTWAPVAEGVDLARLRLPRSTFGAAPPQQLWVQMRSAHDFGDFLVERDSSRDTGSGTGPTATGVYAWATGTTDVRVEDTTVGVAFSVSIFTDTWGGTPLEIHEADRWEPYTDRTVDALHEAARDAVGAALAKGTGNVGFTEDDAADRINASVKAGTVTPAMLDADTNAKREALRDAIDAEGGPTSVGSFPTSPSVGDRVRLLNTQTIPGYGELVAGGTAGQAGYFDADPGFGRLTGAPGNWVDGLISYTQSGNSELRDKTAWIRDSREPRTPSAVIIDGTRYAVTQAQTLTHWHILTGSTGQTLQAGRTYRVQFLFSNGDHLYADQVFQSGDYSFDGHYWIATPGVLTQPSDLRLDDAAELTAGRVVAVDPDNADQFRLVRGLTEWDSGEVSGGFAVTSVNAAKRSSIAFLSPQIDLDNFERGLLWSETTLIRGTTSGPGLGPGAEARIRATELESTSALRDLPVYSASRPIGEVGIPLAQVGVFAGSPPVNRGTLTLALVRNTDNLVGYVWDYTVGQGSGAGNVAVSARWTIVYMPFLA